MVIDFHTHTFPDKMAGAALDMLSGISRLRPLTDGTAAGLAASMARAGVDRSVVLPVATSPGQVPHVNDAAARLNQDWGKAGLLSFACIHPDYPDWRNELARAAGLGLRGIKLHPVYQRVPLDDPRYLRILDRAGELDLIAVTHTGIDVGYPDLDFCAPEAARRAVDQAGPVRLVLAHMGGWKQWEHVAELLAGTSVYLDTSFSTGAMALLDGGQEGPEALALLSGETFLALVRAFGARRILFGTDSPWTGQAESIAWLRDLPGLTPSERTAILGGNAAALLGLEAGTQKAEC